MKRAILYVLVFVGIQFLAGGIVQGGYIFFKGAGTPVDTMGLIITTALADVVTLLVFLLLH